MLAFEFLRGLQSARNHGSIGDHGEIVPRLHDLRFSEWHHEIGAGIWRASVRFTVETLMFEKQYWVIAANSGAQQARRIERVRREDHAQSGSMSKDALAALRVVNGAARQIPANRNADHQRRRECIIRAPADGREFVAQLHHRGPDIVKELNLHYRL